MRRNIAFIFLMALATLAFSASSPHDADSIYFLSLSDIHFDPFISCYGTKKKRTCPLIQMLRESSVAKWPAILAKHDKSKTKFRLDTNYSLLVSSLAAAHDAAVADHAKFVLVLGDTIGHDFRRYYRKYARDSSSQGYQAFTAKTLQFVSNELAKAFPDISVYPVVGNNDSYSRDYGSRVGGRFFSDVAHMWGPLIKGEANRASMQRTLPYAGYYAITRNESKLKVLVLNSVLFSYKAQGRGVKEGAKRQLAWLHRELESAKKNKQKVLIAMHIPTGIDVYATLRTRLFTLIEFWKPAYAKPFKEYLGEYPAQVVGVLSGHMHSDWFQVMTFKGDNEIAMSGTPAISPIFGNNPGFKVYQYSLKNKQISDYYTYSLPLEEKHSWGLEYEFNRIYQPNCHTCSLLDGMKKLQLTGKAAKHYKKYYTVGKETQMQPIAKRWNPYYWCFTRDGNAEEYKKCLG